MDAIDLDVTPETLQGMKRQIKRKNAAFRRGLAMEKEANRSAITRLRLASLAAAASWTVVGIQLLR